MWVAFSLRHRTRSSADTRTVPSPASRQQAAHSRHEGTSVSVGGRDKGARPEPGTWACVRLVACLHSRKTRFTWNGSVGSPGTPK